MDHSEVVAAERLIRTRIEANDGEIETIRIQQKGRDSFLAEVQLAGEDHERQAVIGRDELTD